MPLYDVQLNGDAMFHLFRPAVASAAALALATALAGAPADAQEVRRPVPHRAAPPRGPAPHAAQSRGPGSFAAQPRRGGNGAGVAAGVIGGLAAGAILGGILSNGVARPVPVEEVGGGCPLVRRPVYDGAGQFAGYRTVPSC